MFDIIFISKHFTLSFQIRTTSPGRGRHPASAGRRQEGGRPEQAVIVVAPLIRLLRNSFKQSRQDVVYADAFGEWMAGKQQLTAG